MRGRVWGTIGAFAAAAALALAGCSKAAPTPDPKPPVVFGIKIDPELGRVYVGLEVRTTEPYLDLTVPYIVPIDSASRKPGTPLLIGETVKDFTIDAERHILIAPFQANLGGEFSADSTSEWSSLAVLVDTKTNQILGKRATPGGYIMIEADSGGNRVFAAPGDGGRTHVLDAKTLRLTAELPVKLGPSFLVAMGADSRRGRLFTAARDPGTISVVDLTRNRIAATISIKPSTPHDVAVDSATGTAYVAGSGDPFLYAIDGEPGRVAWTLILETLGDHHVATNSRTGKIYVMDSAGTVTVVDMRRRTVLKTVVLSTSAKLSDLVVDERANLVYVLDEHGNVHLIDGRTDEPAGTIDVPAVVPKPDARVAVSDHIPTIG